MKILFTSIGRRVELIQAFRAAAVRLNTNVEIIGTDLSRTAPALFYCDKQIQTPRIDDPYYIPFLISCCKELKIDALIPTIDTDLLTLAENKERFDKTNVIISTPDKIRVCRDKRLTGDLFQLAGLKYPHTVDDYKKYNLGYPAFIKPKDGSSSKNTYKITDKTELETLAKTVPNYIIQPYISGVEYTVDAFCDFEGNPIFITPRLRLSVRDGEVLKTQICQDKKIISETKIILDLFKPCGPITVQLIRDLSTENDYFIEINPRYGGGAPLSIKAGADSCEMLIRLLKNEKLVFYDNAAENGTIYSRFDQSIKVN